MALANARVLVIEDDPLMRNAVERALKRGGCSVFAAPNADRGMAVLKSETIDLLVLDVVLPGISGLQLLEYVKKDPQASSIPVLVITTQGNETDVVKGLDSGADDYVVKPFSMKVFLARVAALLRRTQKEGRIGMVLEAGAITLDVDAREAKAAGRRIAVTQLEFELLALLMRNAGRVLTLQTLSDALSEGSRIMNSETLYNHVKNLRAKLGVHAARIETIRGLGYKFVRDS